MALIKSVRGFNPKWGENCFFAENATIIGAVAMGNNCSIWFNTVIRGDVNSITMGDNCNIQDGSIIHGTYSPGSVPDSRQGASTTIGNNVSVGHKVILHGCVIEDDVLIGMGAIVMDNAIIKKGAMVAAGAVVLEGTIVESNTLYAGVPAKYIRNLTLSDKERIERISKNYLFYKEWYRL